MRGAAATAVSSAGCGTWPTRLTAPRRRGQPQRGVYVTSGRCVPVWKSAAGPPRSGPFNALDLLTRGRASKGPGRRSTDLGALRLSQEVFSLSQDV